MFQALPDNVERYLTPAFLEHLIRETIDIAWIVVLGIIAMRLIDTGLKRVRTIVAHGNQSDPRHAEKRTETLRGIVRKFSKLILAVVVLMMISQALGFNVGPLLGTAGVAGLAIAFAAQSLVKDFITGFFILLEDQYAVGDLVKIGEHDGVVERMTLRSTVLRNFDGQTHIIPNGNIQVVTLIARTWKQAVVDLTFAHVENLDRVRAALARASSRLFEELKDAILQPPVLLGIEQLGHDGVTLRLAVKTDPLRQSEVKRLWFLYIKEELDRDGIALAEKKP